jgi:uncharacterized membrane protein YtjA (UPF0391 family)
MIRYAMVFAILALICGLLGFVGLEGNFAFIARVLLFVFTLLFLLSVILGRRSIRSVI